MISNIFKANKIKSENFINTETGTFPNSSILL